MSRILNFYLNGEYYKNNPTWDVSDTDWKFNKLHEPMKRFLPLKGAQVYEIGCGSGELLKKFAQTWPDHNFYGFDIAPDAARFWQHTQSNLQFQLSDFSKNPPVKQADALLLIDVLEHLADPCTFLEELRGNVRFLVVHLPLDMNIVNILFDKRLLNLRDSIGHIHYFTKSLGEKLLKEAGYEVVYSEYTNAWKDSPNLSLLGKVFRVIRRVLNWINPTLNAKLLGGESLVMIAKSLQ